MDPYRPRRYSTDKPDSEIHLAPRAQAPEPPEFVPRLAPQAAVRYAEWRQTDRASRAAGEQAMRAAFVLYLGLCLPLLVAGFTFGLVHGTAWFFTVLNFWALVGVLIKRANLREQERADRLEAMRDDGGAVQYAAKARFFAGREMFESDYGLLSVVGGRLYFVGERVSFSFSARAARLAGGNSRSGYARRPRFELLRYGQNFAVEFTQDPGSVAGPLLQNELTRFSNARIEPGSVEVLPPTHPSPQALAEQWAFTRRGFLALAGLYLLPNIYFLGSWIDGPTWAAQLASGTFTVSTIALGVMVVVLWRVSRRRALFLRRLIDEDATYGVRRG